MTIQNVKIEFQSRLTNFYDTKEIQALFELVAENVGFSKIDIVLNGSQELSESQITFFSKTLMQLEKQEPVQYILGKTDFYELPIIVSSAVLIPRQETEILVDCIIKENKKEQVTIFDIGTGSGCIAISLAKYITQSKVYALDISPEALEIASKNAELNAVSISFLQGDMLTLESCKTIPECDIIVSNPPYIRNLEQAEMKPNVLNFEPHTALFVPDLNPLVFYEAIAKIAQQKLTLNGFLYCEINEAFGKETVALFEKYEFKNCKIIEDLHGKQRFVKCNKNVAF